MICRGGLPGSPGSTYLGSAARFRHTDGAFARYVNLPARMLRELPAGLDLRTAALKDSFRFNDEIVAVITALADGTLHINPVTTHEYPVQDAVESFATARNSAESGKVLLNFQPK